MAARGRRSASSLTVVPQITPSRPEPPAELSAAAAEEWRAVVARMPADWFTREVQPLLAAFCQHSVRARDLGQQLDALGAGALADEEGIRLYDRLAKMADRESRAMGLLATKLRLTHQSRYTPQRAGTAARNAGSGRRPWEFAAD
jgi:phage terminase small subunit